MKAMSLSDWLLLVILGTLWGGAFIFTGLAVKELRPLTIVALRVGTAALVMTVAMIVTGRRYPPSGRKFGEFAVMGLFNNVIPFTLITWGQTGIPAGLASIINASAPLFTIILAHFFTRDEKFTANRLIGVLIGIGAVAFLVGPENLTSGASSLLPRLAILGAAFSYSIGGIFGKRFARDGIHPIVVSAGQLTASAAVMLPLAAIVDAPWRSGMPDATVIGALVGLALLSTCLAYIIYFRLLGRNGAGNVLTVTMIIPFVAMGIGAVVLKERVEIGDLAAFAVLVIGLLTIDGRVFRALRKIVQRSLG